MDRYTLTISVLEMSEWDVYEEMVRDDVKRNESTIDSLHWHEETSAPTTEEAWIKAFSELTSMDEEKMNIGHIIFTLVDREDINRSSPVYQIRRIKKEYSNHWKHTIISNGGSETYRLSGDLTDETIQQMIIGIS